VTRAKAMKVCNVPGCPELVPGGTGRCPDHRRAAEHARGNATQRGYSSRGHQRFRAAVLRRDPICVVCQRAASTVADHWPTSRRELEAGGKDPNDPRHGRGLCASCHGKETAAHQPGGFNRR
jgi:5-methylcytosine-specific restriction protein A